VNGTNQDAAELFVTLKRTRTRKMRKSVPDKSRAALERLIQIAQGDAGHSRIVANFLLAWWNAAECAGFDLTGVWAAIPRSPWTCCACLRSWPYPGTTRTPWVTAGTSSGLSAPGGQLCYIG
jgi:hypothetical protein